MPKLVAVRALNAALLGLAFAAFNTVVGAAARSDRTYLPVETIQELMSTQIDPFADQLWAAVSTTVTAAGATERQPRTPTEWQTVRRCAVSLIEAANLLLLGRREVADKDTPTDDAGVPGIESPQAIQRAIDANPAAFRTAVVALRDASVNALAAVDAKNADALIDAGGVLDACEGCHLRYWYPHSPRPHD